MGGVRVLGNNTQLGGGLWVGPCSLHGACPASDSRAGVGASLCGANWEDSLSPSEGAGGWTV